MNKKKELRNISREFKREPQRNKRSFVLLDSANVTDKLN